MNSNQRSEANNQSDNGANELPKSSGRNTKDELHQQSGSPGVQQGSDGAASKTGGGHLAADEKMDDDTGFSNTVNRPPVDADQGSRQAEQSNVGRRDDGTPD